MLCLLAPSTFGSIASRAGIISLLGLGGISLCELSKAFFYLLQRLPHFLWIRWPFTVGMGCGVWRSFAFSTHCLVNEPESGYCRLSSSDRDSAVPCLIDISLSSISTQNPPIKPHSTFSLITKHWLACQCPGQDLMNTHLMFAHLYPLSLSLSLLFIKDSGEESWGFRLRLDLQEIHLNQTFNLVFRFKSVNPVTTSERKYQGGEIIPFVASTSQLLCSKALLIQWYKFRNKMKNHISNF